MRILFACVMLSLFVGPAIAQQAPTGMPPRLDVVQLISRDQGTVTCQKIIVVTEIRQIVQKIQQDGKDVLVTKTVAVPVTNVASVVIPLATSRVLTSDGKQLAIEDVWKRLKVNSAVAVSVDGNTPAPAFLRALNADTLIIVPGQPKNVPAPK